MRRRTLWSCGRIGGQGCQTIVSCKDLPHTNISMQIIFEAREGKLIEVPKDYNLNHIRQRHSKD
jgi:hypothetical protein